jgi:hypothetical protein
MVYLLLGCPQNIENNSENPNSDCFNWALDDRWFPDCTSSCKTKTRSRSLVKNGCDMMWRNVTECLQVTSEFGLPVLSSAFGALESHAEINKVPTFQGALQLQRCQRWTACPGNAGVFKTRSPVEDNTSSHGVFDIQLVFKTFYIYFLLLNLRSQPLSPLPLELHSESHSLLAGQTSQWTSPAPQHHDPKWACSKNGDTQIVVYPLTWIMKWWWIFVVSYF